RPAAPCGLRPCPWARARARRRADARRSGARTHHPDPGAARLESLASGGCARDRAHHALAEAQGVRDREVACPVDSAIHVEFGTACEQPMDMATILLVDDEASARLTLSLLLKRRGHVIQEADGVIAATKALAGATFDVVITDLRMPDGQGLDVLRAARARNPDANVILLTAHPPPESANHAIPLGAFDYFEKGQEPDGLFQRIDKALQEQASRRHL